MPGPREGIYLDSALAIVEQQVNERIDAVTHRRRTASRALIVGLLVTTLGGGVATAAALTITPAPAAPSMMVESSLELHCVDGPATIVPAVFTARLSVRAKAGSELDLAAVCAGARVAVASDSAGTLQDSTPDELLRVATDIVTASATQSSNQSSNQSADVAEASFGPLQPSAPTPTRFTTCERASDGRVVVLMTAGDAGADSVADESARCLANDGYRLYKETS
ncbi:hypothetical protein B0I08_105297 [Glaciihabitans tibetensis]|uniref:Uncharacterized protein n=2 Tax=Glaciihabitans tibetensis TaxID=1266600 RepID=A0A2T0VD80_9MICO|nr:hypothetical protein B0I08_105297 [Glaciihabitans tibetensis]